MTVVGHNLTFIDRGNNRRCGAVWAAGPRALTWWVVVHELDHTPPRRFVLVQVARGVAKEVDQ